MMVVRLFFLTTLCLNMLNCACENKNLADSTYDANHKIEKHEVEGELDDVAEKEVLKKIFGTAVEHRDELMDFTVLLDNEKVGEVKLLMGKEKKIHSKSLKNVLKDYLNEEEVEKIDQLTAADGFIDFKSLSFLKLDTKFNFRLLQLEITVPVNMKKTRSLGTKAGRHREKPNVKPASLSGYLTTRFSQSFSSTSVESKKNTAQAKACLFTGAVNVRGLVLEGEASYNKSTGSKGKFYRSYTTLVYDMPENNITVRAGDVFSSSTGYQSVPRLIGFGLQKSVPITTTENFNDSINITLLRTSTIEVYVNDVLTKTKTNISPGPYTLDDIPYIYGTNNIKIRIIDDTGREQFLDSTMFMDTSFIGYGQSGYEISAGYPEANNDQGRYDKKNTVLSGSIKYGIFHATELSVGVQKNKIGGSCTVSVRNISELGNIDCRVAGSSYKAEGTDKKVKGNVIYASYSTPTIKVLDVGFSCGASIESADTFFYPYLGQSLVSSDYEEDTSLYQRKNIKGKNNSVRYFVHFNNFLSSSWNINYSTRAQPNSVKERSFSINASRGFSLDSDTVKNGYINCSFERTKSSLGRVNRSLRLSVSFSLADSTSISCGYAASPDSSYSCSASKYSSSVGLGYNLSYSSQKNSRNYNASVNYSHPRFKANINHGGSNNSSSSSTSSSTTSRHVQVGVETGVFFADGVFSIAGLNVGQGGFVIARPVNALENTSIKFLRNTSESGILGGAVIPTHSRNISVAKLDLADIPNHMEIKKDTIISEGLYKRGAVFDVSCEGEYMVEGILHDSDQKPITLVSGYAIHTTNKDADPVQFFTNEDGDFVINNLVLGKYTVKVNFEGCKDFEIEVKDSETHVSNLGKIICEKEIVKNDEETEAAAPEEAAATAQDGSSGENPMTEPNNGSQNTTTKLVPDNSSADADANNTGIADTNANTANADAAGATLSYFFNVPEKLPTIDRLPLCVKYSPILPAFHTNLGRA
jgi:outer membrane usher protein